MLHTYLRPAGNSVTGSASTPTSQYGLLPQERAALQRDIGTCRATIADSQQRCSDARDLLAVATERLMCSRDFLATG